MEISFIIKNDKGDQLRVALSRYHETVLSSFTSDPTALSLEFYDVTLMRETGSEYIEYTLLSKISA